MMERELAVPKVTGRLPGKHARKWVRFHMMHAAPSTYELEFVRDRSKPATGPFCTDVDGNVFIDFMSHVGAAPLGYNNPKIIELLESMPYEDPDRYAGTDFITAYGEHVNQDIPTPSHLHAKIHAITKHLGLDTAFFSNSGAEAVENAIKVCYHYKENRGYGICFRGSFHGRTLGTLSLNRSKQVHKRWYPQIPNVYDLPFCSCGDVCTCDWKRKAKTGEVVSGIKELLDKERGFISPKEVAYIILEPIQGEGGYRIANNDFVKEVYEEAHKHNIPVISDEVQSGLGRTGKWWCIEHYKQKPDLIVSAKGLRIGATIGKRIMFPKEGGRLSSTWGEGNAIASAVGWKTIDIIQKENLLDNARLKGTYLIHELQDIESRFSFLEHARGIGLMDAITVDTKERRDKILQHCLNKGLVLAGCGWRSIRFLPPLDVTKREIDIALAILRKACRQ